MRRAVTKQQQKARGSMVFWQPGMDSLELVQVPLPVQTMQLWRERD